MESEAPEYCLVVLQASESIPRVPEYNILPVDVICRQTLRVTPLHSGVDQHLIVSVTACITSYRQEDRDFYQGLSK